MKLFVEKLIEWLEEISVSKSEEGIINGCNMGICEDDDCLKCLKKKLISNINKLSEEYLKSGKCMNDCEHFDNCSDYIYSKGYKKAISDFKNVLLNWNTQDEEYRNLSNVCNEIEILLNK